MNDITCTHITTPTPCPTCGHCPTCGRSGYQAAPYPPWRPYTTDARWEINLGQNSGPQWEIQESQTNPEWTTWSRT